MNNNPKDPAFPADETHGDGIQQIRHHLGLTIRQYTAIEMAKGLLSAHDTAHLTFADVADRALQQADAVLDAVARAEAA